jgi:phosphoglycolate phosphatase
MCASGVVIHPMSSTAYDFWLFDLDGTLVDVEPEYANEVLSLVGDRIGHEFSTEDCAALWYGLAGDPDDLLREKGIDPVRFWSAFHAVEDRKARAAATFLYDDAERVLTTLDCPVGLVTHCQQYLTDPVLDQLAIQDWFDTVVCCTEESGWKPDPTPVRMAIDEMGIGDNGDRGVLVGDSPDDIGAAWNAGLDGAHIERHSHGQRGLCVRGDHRVTRLDELINGADSGAAMD